MLQDLLLTQEERALKQEVRDFAKREVPADLIGMARPYGTRSTIHRESLELSPSRRS